VKAKFGVSICEKWNFVKKKMKKMKKMLKK